MGWASWNHYFCDYDEQAIRAQADALVSSGMRELGYKYVLIQECLTQGRRPSGDLIVDAARFPDGMKALADYIHARGLKAGIYTDIGVNTCAGKPYQGSFQHEDQDAAQFAAWGMDFVEMDYCNCPEGYTGEQIYRRMAEAIAKTGRPMLLYICSWGNESPWTWARGVAQLWRTEADVSGEKNHVQWLNVVRNFQSNGRHAVFSAPNSWNDPDMMEVGNPGLTATEAETHMSMWAISAAPLWAGADLTSMDAETRSIYTNSEAIAIDQDPLGAGAIEVKEYGQIEIWAKPLASLASGSAAVMLLNLGSQASEAEVEWKDIGLTGALSLRDLWAHKDLLPAPSGYKTILPAHGAALLRVGGAVDWARGVTYEAEWPANLMSNGAELLPCPECSQGYAVKLDGKSAAALTFPRLQAPQSGSYVAAAVYVCNGESNPVVEVTVNGKMRQVKLTGAIYATAPIPVELNQGENTIEFQYKGEGSFSIDRLTITR